MTLSGAIIDLDGTVYVGGDVLDGVEDGIQSLREVGTDVLFFSNNPVRTGQEYVDYLSERGIPVSDGQACSSGDVTTAYLKEAHPNDDILYIGSDGLREQFESAGLEVVTDGKQCDSLVVSWTPEFDYHDMRRVVATVEEETSFLGTDPDRTFQRSENEVIPGSGAIIGAVASAIGREPDAVLGKPSEQAQEFALSRLEQPPEECLVVGDRLDTDLALGERAGMTTVLVLTGVTDRSDLERSRVEPDYVIDSLADIDTVLDSLDE